MEINEIILKYKDPQYILDLLNKYNMNNYVKLYFDPNGFIWNDLIETHFRKYLFLKNRNISLKDFYVLIFFAELLGLLDIDKIILRSQLILNKLPKIYDGDHICILNACCNTAILSQKYNLHLFRKENINNKSKIFGKGKLKYQYIISNSDIYSDEIYENIDNTIDINNGCINPSC